MARAHGTREQAVKRGLARAIRTHRTEGQPVETARSLVSYDSASNRLVGVTAQARTAVFFDQERLSMIEARFDVMGPTNGRGVVIASFESSTEFQEWLCGVSPEYWEWIHPRYARRGDDDGSDRLRPRR